ncbi:type II secretion system ATPase GspE [Chitinivorax sp. PXF-14]|uniref:type II secretion system ATPase GspE n=1 Tax=Chitinivorax sp. PXF-14 TaxID=3230488 RepID=UPI003467C086
MDRRIPYHFAKNKGVIDVGEKDGVIEIWARDDVDLVALSEVRRVMSRPLAVSLFPASEFEQRLASVYSRGDSQAASVVEDVEQDYDLSRLAQELPEVEDLLEAEDDAPIIRLINAVLTQALREHASDVHIEPFETRSVVRFRIDGKLIDVVEPKRALHAALVSRIKVMANLDISEKRLPQDGRITLRIAGRPVDVRVSTLPTGHGERVVLRLLDKSAGKMDLTRLGMSGLTLNGLKELIAQPHGILLVTGPTGSGKTTTLYAALSQMDAKTTNIMTVEDPIEYDLDGVGQTQVNARIEMSFSRALRSILRQDPDVIMIGEIRDLETAQIAVQASLTGHLVLATLHTNDAASAVTRLMDMGIEPFLLASSLIGVLAQRLARNLCPECRQPRTPDDAEAEVLGARTTIYTAHSCPACNYNGYRGRSGIYELLTIDDTIRHMIHDGKAESDIRDYAVSKGMHSLRQDGMRKVLAGDTTLEEIVRVTRES